ncbi:MAG: antibiotic biosynthesis monooxygenase [Chloroflexi bacterium]|nr:antibiotic biosynthesis monooxygenase [Chloroflexota bacterium]
MSRFGMFGKLTAYPGQRDALVQHLLTAATLVGSAPGCELYVVSTSPTEPDTIWVTEAWRSKADHVASLSIAGVQELIAKARPLIAAMSEPILLTPVGGKGLTADSGR